MELYIPDMRYLSIVLVYFAKNFLNIKKKYFAKGDSHQENGKWQLINLCQSVCDV